jgi:hypothetical protein
LAILAEYKPYTNGSGFLSIAQKHGLNASTVYEWYKNKSKYLDEINKTNATHLTRLLCGAGRKCQYPDIDFVVINWVKERNMQGLKVLDKYIQAFARETAKNIKADCFKASYGWLNWFKNRYNLVSRRQTTSRMLPEYAVNLATEFLFLVRNIIDEKKNIPKKHLKY